MDSQPRAGSRRWWPWALAAWIVLLAVLLAWYWPSSADVAPPLYRLP